MCRKDTQLEEDKKGAEEREEGSSAAIAITDSKHPSRPVRVPPRTWKPNDLAQRDWMVENWVQRNN